MVTYCFSGKDLEIEIVIFIKFKRRLCTAFMKLCLLIEGLAKDVYLVIFNN